MSTQGLYLPRTRHRGLIQQLVRFTGANGANPTSLFDPGGIVNTAVRTSEGLYTLTLKNKWLKIFCNVNIQSTDGTYSARAVCVDGLSATNTIKVYAFISTAAADATLDDLDGVKFDLTVSLLNT